VHAALPAFLLPQRREDMTQPFASRFTHSASQHLGLE
jgi:hypothetical protein